MSSRVHLQWSPADPATSFRTEISLHSHTLYSQECLDFIYPLAARAPALRAILRRGGEHPYEKNHGAPLDLRRGWWTPPLGPYGAWELERGQIEGIGLRPLVSLTDHDGIEAPVSLQLLHECRDTPVSTEWTVPFGATFFHLGVHNLPRGEARMLFDAMDDYRRTPDPQALGGILAELTARPALLLVFNRPLWDEKGIGQELHEYAAFEFLRQFGDYVHALEINGLRPWYENRRVLNLSQAIGKPTVSGGDRHVLEPNALLNLSEASTFSEFVEEVREGWSDRLILSHYRQSHAVRILRNFLDVLRSYERHANGWRLWSDRAFYRCPDRNARSLTELFGEGVPLPVTVLFSCDAIDFDRTHPACSQRAFSSAECTGLGCPNLGGPTNWEVIERS